MLLCLRGSQQQTSEWPPWFSRGTNMEAQNGAPAPGSRQGCATFRGSQTPKQESASLTIGGSGGGGSKGVSETVKWPATLRLLRPVLRGKETLEVATGGPIECLLYAPGAQRHTSRLRLNTPPPSHAAAQPLLTGTLRAHACPRGDTGSAAPQRVFPRSAEWSTQEPGRRADRHAWRHRGRPSDPVP